MHCHVAGVVVMGWAERGVNLDCVMQLSGFTLWIWLGGGWWGVGVG